VDRRLGGVHLCPHRRVNPIGADQQCAVRLGGRAVGAFDQRRDAAPTLAIAGNAMAEADGVRSRALDQLVMQQHVEAAAVHRVLRPVIAGVETARLGIDVVAIQPHQRPFLGGQADPVEIALADAEVVQLAHGVRLHVDADAERAHLPHRLEDDAGHTDLVQRQRRGEAPDAAAGDDHRIVRQCSVRSAVV
jgi:hypothetical protein